MHNNACVLTGDNHRKTCVQWAALSTGAIDQTLCMGITVGNFEHFFSTASPALPTTPTLLAPLFVGDFSTPSTPPIKNEYKVYE